MRFPILTLASVMLAAVANADVMVGTGDAGNGNCIPFSCSSFAGTTYQQLYSSSSFSGPINITSLSFFNTKFNNPGQSLAMGTFTLSLSTVSAAVGTFTSVIAQGVDASQIFSG